MSQMEGRIGRLGYFITDISVGKYGSRKWRTRVTWDEIPDGGDSRQREMSWFNDAEPNMEDETRNAVESVTNEVRKRSKSMPPKVHILCTPKNAAGIPGSTVVFDTVRVGFPTAEIFAYDNGTPYWGVVRDAALAAGAKFAALPEEMYHCEWVRQVIELAEGPTVILDPDMVFWSEVENWQFDGCLLAGRLLPEYVDEVNHNLISKARIHTSFWWIPDPAALREAIREVEQAKSRVFAGSLWYPFQSFAYPEKDGSWSFFDVGANLYAALKDKMRPFTPEELDAYDHVFAGSCPEVVKRRLNGGGLLGHRAVREGQLWRLKGLWRLQEAHFQKRATA